MNPVSAGIVKDPGEYRWSSYHVNGQGSESSLICPHSLYLELDRADGESKKAYRELFRYELESKEIDKIRKATNGNFAFALGNDRFTMEISEMLGRRVTPFNPGHPTKKAVTK